MQTSPLLDVRRYPPRLLRRAADGLHIAVHYRAEWPDGYGARGWKLEATLNDPEIIASTRETGARLPTSVLIHDLLDHLLCGFAPSGHRAEAMALAQLALRTGVDIRADYAQMAREDLMHGRVLGGGRLCDFLSARHCRVPGSVTGDDRELAQALTAHLGAQGFEQALVEGFYALGRRGHAHARASLAALGIAASRRGAIGRALQQALQCLDTQLQHRDTEAAVGTVWIGPRACGIRLRGQGGSRIRLPAPGRPARRRAGSHGPRGSRSGSLSQLFT